MRNLEICQEMWGSASSGEEKGPVRPCLLSCKTLCLAKTCWSIRNMVFECVWSFSSLGRDWLELKICRCSGPTNSYVTLVWTKIRPQLATGNCFWNTKYLCWWVFCTSHFFRKRSSCTQVPSQFCPHISPWGIQFCLVPKHDPRDAAQRQVVEL